jgi:di/tricarboxylate transporter
MNILSLLLMTTDAWIVLGIIAVALVFFITEWLAIDVVALLIMVTLVLTGVITADKAMGGFSNNAPITVAFMFVLSHAIIKTGILNTVAPKLAAYFRKSEMLGMAITMLVVATISAFINNTPVVAVFIPVMIHVAKLTGIPASRLLIPVSYATIFGGCCTLIGTSTNIIVSGMAEKAGLEGLGMFTLAPIGILTMVCGTIYMVLIGTKLLPDRGDANEMTERFNVSDYTLQFRIGPKSALVGARIMDSQLLRGSQIDIIDVVRGEEKFAVPPGDMVLHAGDMLKVRCDIERIKSLRDSADLVFIAQEKQGSDDAKGATKLVELVVKYGSGFEGKTLRELDIRRSFRAVPLGLRHREELINDHINDIELRTGDVILIEIKSHFLPELKKLENSSGDFIIIAEEELNSFDRAMAIKVILTLLAVVITAAFEVVPIVIGTIVGVLYLVLSKVLTMKEAYKSIQWQIVFLIVGALSLGEAMKSSGLADLAAHQMVGSLGAYGPFILLSAFYFCTSFLTEIMSNNATAALLTPLAISAAQAMGVSAMPFIIAITMGASASFATPIGYQTNSMVYTAGNYTFADFLRVGVPLNILFWIVSSILIPILYPF